MKSWDLVCLHDEKPPIPSSRKSENKSFPLLASTCKICEEWLAITSRCICGLQGDMRVCLMASTVWVLGDGVLLVNANLDSDSALAN
eukprot:1413582-Amphidinium_carterae.1